MRFGKKILLAVVLYTLPLIAAAAFGLFREKPTNIALALVTSSLLGLLFYFFLLVGLVPGHPPSQTAERMGLNADVANRIDQMPSHKRETLGQTILQIVGVYASILVIFGLAALLVG